MYLPDHRIIFIHNHKTAGMSIEQWLRGKAPILDNEFCRHETAGEMIARIGWKAWNESFSFGFVRNPWDRLVSWWLMLDSNRGANQDSTMWRYMSEHVHTFDAFVKCTVIFPFEKGMSENPTRPQIEYFRYENSLAVSFIGRFEKLHEDMQSIFNCSTLPHCNKGPEHDYRSFYTQELRDIVAERFAVDVKCFGYSF